MEQLAISSVRQQSVKAKFHYAIQLVSRSQTS